MYVKETQNDFLNIKYEEPVEVRLLKQQLKSLSCECDVCARANKDRLIPYDVETRTVNDFTDTGVQAECDIPIDFYNSLNTCDFHVCGSCAIAMNFLQDNFNKILKEEESETVTAKMSDKYVGSTITYSEKSTIVSKSSLKQSHVTICEDLNHWYFSEAKPKKKLWK
ncbi:unnamed protein product [Arctia plantaginis]|uniref:Uncharacterized protein n=1 Tax=Arctia plantaginis TaxID=874455 RepID=A0A8S0Z2F0_ARCPL|nr:unnamed protein product [Arctia plantaginis]CAB3254786.1 unnamed protein product [Arctia plantaginis]